MLGWVPPSVLLSRGSPAGRSVYLTFDDGPHPEHTPAILDALDRHAVQASFFVIGAQAEAHPDLVRRAHDAGHVIGNHSQTHPDFRRLPLAAQLAEIDAADRVLRAIVGDRPIPFRTPWGALPPRLIGAMALRRRPVVYWTYDSLDYRRPALGELVGLLSAQPPRPGDIVLMHDDGALAAPLLHAVLPRWKASGLTFRTLPPVAAAP